MNNNPFAYDTEIYLWVVLFASIAGIAKFTDTCVKTKSINMLVLVRDLFTGILTGFMAFWLCEYLGLLGPFSNVAIVVGGFLGTNAMEEVKGIILTVLNAYIKEKK